MKKEQINIYVHLELLDRNPSGVITSVLLIPFGMQKDEYPVTDDGEVKEVINIDSFFKMFMPYFGCSRREMNEILDINCVLEESLAIHTQLLNKKTIDPAYVKKRFSCRDYLKVDNAINSLDMNVSHMDTVCSHAACYIRTLQEKYDVRLWVRDINVEGVILKEFLDVYSEVFEDNEEINKDGITINPFCLTGANVHDLNMLEGDNDPDPYRLAVNYITGIYTRFMYRNKNKNNNS